jgi:hypothetical protein
MMMYLHDTGFTFSKGLFGIAIPETAFRFFSDDGFGNYVAFDNSVVQVFASTEALLLQTCGEQDEAPLPNLID